MSPNFEPVFLANTFAVFIPLIILLYLAISIRDWIRKDYQGFLSLGPGGVLPTLPKLAGPRPTISGIAPQRQMNQRVDNDTFETLSTMLRDLANRYPTRLRVGTSFLERHTIALFSNRDRPEVDRCHAVFGNEIAHPHKIDEGMHLIMHPADIRVVLESQWGERHPLARANPPQNLLDLLWLTYFRRFEGRPPVPEELVLIYALRNEEEVEVMKTMVRAAAWFCTGGGIDGE